MTMTTNTGEREKLEPCPFCGGAAAHGLWAGNVMAVRCLRCFSEGPATKPVPEVCINIRPYIDEAYRLWNRRPSPPAGEGEPVLFGIYDSETGRWWADKAYRDLERAERYVASHSLAYPTIEARPLYDRPLPSTAGGEREAWPVAAIAEQMDEGAGFWRPCSGCQEGVDGYVSSKDYPYSRAFRCQPGGGCRECGGIGVIWDTTDYDAMARDMLAEDQEASPPREPETGEREAGAKVSRIIAGEETPEPGSWDESALAGYHRQVEADREAIEAAIEHWRAEAR